MSLVSFKAQNHRQQVGMRGALDKVDDRRTPPYAAVLGEEFGEVCNAWLERDVPALREELVQVAAVAIAWIEEIDNGGGAPRSVLEVAV